MVNMIDWGGCFSVSPIMNTGSAVPSTLFCNACLFAHISVPVCPQANRLLPGKLKPNTQNVVFRRHWVILPGPDGGLPSLLSAIFHGYPIASCREQMRVESQNVLKPVKLCWCWPKGRRDHLPGAFCSSWWLSNRVKRKLCSGPRGFPSF